MDNKSYTKLDLEKLESSEKNPNGSFALKRNSLYISLTALIGISIIVTFFLFTRKVPHPSVSKINTEKVTINPTKLSESTKVVLNSADIEDKNVFEKSTFDKSKVAKTAPPKDPYATATVTPKPTKTVKKVTPTKTQVIAQAKKPTPTITQPKATITITKPTVTPTKALKPTATVTPKPTATTKPSPTLTKVPSPTIKPSNKPTAMPTKVVVTPTVKPTSIPSPTPTIQKTNNSNQKTYVVKKGDNLWNISQQIYGNGYKAGEIAKANNLTNAGVIYAGQKLILPQSDKKTTIIAQAKTVNPPTVTPTVKATKPEILAANTKSTDKTQKYTVVHGDNLWNIAKNFYGDGFEWKRIASANKLAQPGIIHAGNILSIPPKK